MAAKTKQRERTDTSCKGWNFHVFCLGADRCSMCGKRRSEVQK